MSFPESGKYCFSTAGKWKKIPDLRTGFSLWRLKFRGKIHIILTMAKFIAFILLLLQLLFCFSYGNDCVLDECSAPVEMSHELCFTGCQDCLPGRSEQTLLARRISPYLLSEMAAIPFTPVHHSDFFLEDIDRPPIA